MKGQDEYKSQYKNRIDKIINDNENKDYLEGFYYFTCNSKLNGLSSSYTYLNNIINFMNDVNKSVNELSLDDYTIYLGKLKDKSASYQINVYSSLKKFSKYLLATKRNVDDPMQYIDRPKFSESINTVEKRDRNYLTKAETKKIIKNINNGVGSFKAKARQEEWKERDEVIIILFVSTGLRCSALYKLDVSDIDFEKHIFRTIEKGNKIREVFLTDKMLKYIKCWLDKRDILLAGKECDALFISNRRKRLTQKGISDIVHKYGASINRDNLSPHKLRATFGTTFYNETHDIRLLQSLMGHSSVRTTQTYIRGQNKEQEEAANIMSKAFAL